MQKHANKAKNKTLPEGDSPLIGVKNISLRFGKNPPTLSDLSFEVEEGQIFCLLGPSGSGKSTVMRLLTGVLAPDSGQVRVLGTDPLNFNRKTRRQLGYMPQQFVLFPELSTLDNINFIASAYGMSWLDRARKVKEVLEFVDLWPARHRLVTHLSGGMRRRLDLASSLVHSPRLFFMDEPTAGIDPMLRAKFWDHFKTLRDEGHTIFITTQYVTEADYCDRVAILNRGRLLAIGTPEEVRRQAIGGEIIALELEKAEDNATVTLQNIAGIKQILNSDPLSYELLVDQASESLPQVILAFQSARIAVRSIEPYRPDFEEVFVRLMEQDLPANRPARADTLKDSLAEFSAKPVISKNRASGTGQKEEQGGELP